MISYDTPMLFQKLRRGLLTDLNFLESHYEGPLVSNAVLLDYMQNKYYWPTKTKQHLDVQTRNPLRPHPLPKVSRPMKLDKKLLQMDSLEQEIQLVSFSKINVLRNNFPEKNIVIYNQQFYFQKFLLWSFAWLMGFLIRFLPTLYSTLPIYHNLQLFHCAKVQQNFRHKFELPF